MSLGTRVPSEIAPSLGADYLRERSVVRDKKLVGTLLEINVVDVTMNLLQQCFFKYCIRTGILWIGTAIG